MFLKFSWSSKGSAENSLNKSPTVAKLQGYSARSSLSGKDAWGGSCCQYHVVQSFGQSTGRPEEAKNLEALFTEFGFVTQAPLLGSGTGSHW